jgi:hypothetical protein
MVGVKNKYVFINSCIYTFVFNSDDFINGGQIFEEPILQFIECKQPDPNNQLIASPQEQLMGSSKFNIKCKFNFLLL